MPETDTNDEALLEERGAFVTLRHQGDLRGCLGYVEGTQSLIEAVADNAAAAALRDPRFMPVKPDELDDIEIEISALTRPEPVDSPNDIRIGIDGVVLSKHGRRAVYLPQVAPEQGWDVQTMLMHLSLKAGLSADSWMEDAQFLTFQAEIFSESEK